MSAESAADKSPWLAAQCTNALESRTVDPRFVLHTENRMVFSLRCAPPVEHLTPHTSARDLRARRRLAMRAASSEPTMRRRGRIARPISSARVSPRPVPALSLACLLLALFVPVREVSATRAFGSPAPSLPRRASSPRRGGRFVDPSDGSTFHVAGANCYYLVYSAARTRAATSTTGSRRCLKRRSSSTSTYSECGRFRTSGGRRSAPFRRRPGSTTSGSWSRSTRSSREPRREAYDCCCASPTTGKTTVRAKRFCYFSFPATTATTATARAPARVLTSTLIPPEPLPPVPPACPSQAARSLTRQVGARGWRARAGRRASSPPRGLFHAAAVPRLVQGVRFEDADARQRGDRRRLPRRPHHLRVGAD